MGTLVANLFMACQSSQDLTTQRAGDAQQKTSVNARVNSTTGNIFGNTVPQTAAWPDFQAVTLGVKFKSSIAGKLSGIRLYRGVTGPTTLTATLWTETGTALASGVLSLPGGVTEAGWFEVPFTNASGGRVDVPIQANTIYVASYHTPTGQYPAENEGLANDVATANAFGGTLTALGGVANGGNGVYVYNGPNQFPTQSFRNTNYFVDVMFSTYANILGNSLPAVGTWPDPNAVTLGVKLKSSADGFISGIRVYRGEAVQSNYQVALWSADGQLLAQGTSAGTLPANAWIEVPFDGGVKVPVTANTTYVASYYSLGGYAGTNDALNDDIVSTNAFGSTLTALGGIANGGNGVYVYGSALQFPTQSFRNTNYFVDVLYDQD
jgi:hypothetical protein